MRFALTVTGPAYGTQQASSARNLPEPCCRKAMSWRAFFYREGVLNANQLTAPASDEFDLVRGWQSSTMSTASRCISAWRPPCVVA